MRRAYAYTLVIVLFWGTSLVTNKALLLAQRGGQRLTPLQVAFWGIGLGWATLLVALAARGRLRYLRLVPARGWAVLALMGFCGWAGYAVSLNYAFTRLPLPDAIVINYLHPVFVVLFQGPVFGGVVRRLTGWEWVAEARRPSAARLAAGLALCLLGVAVIATGGRLGSLGRGASAPGALAALFAALCWGAYSNLGRFIPPRRPGEPQLPSDLQSLLAMSFGIVFLAGALAAGRGVVGPGGFTARLFLGSVGPAPVAAWWLLGVMGVMVYGGSYTLWLHALELGARLGEAHKLPPITYLTPVFGVALGWLVLHEPFGPGFWQGAVLIAAGNAVNVWRRARRQTPALAA